MVCDFFFPKVGGVESHIYMLSQTLIDRGHKVVIVTHAHPPDRYSVRYLTRGLKVYYLPLRIIPPKSMHATLPNFFAAFPLLRQIFVRERIQIVHAHGALSALGLEAIVHAKTMRLKAVFTEHSIIGLGGFGEMWGNKMLHGCLADIDAVICVSHASKDNTAVRAHLDPQTIYVIPSAVVASEFRPDGNLRNSKEVIIVCMSRLVYRKGIDLLIAAIPKICARFEDVRFMIGGDGPKMIELEQMLEKYQSSLKSKVQLLGAVKHEDVKQVLRQGDIFLNTALTEAFGIGILEAACCGLYIVSTRVGGVPEVLPSHLIELAEPSVKDVVRAVSQAVLHLKTGKHDAQATHEEVKHMYLWADVARRTEKVYVAAASQPQSDMHETMRRYSSTGPIFGQIMCIVIMVDFVILFLLECFWPTAGIDVAPAFRQDVFDQLCRQHNDSKDKQDPP